MVSGGRIIAQKRRRFVAIHNDNVNVAVVVEVSEGSATALMLRGNARPGFIAQFHKSAIA